MEEGRSRQEGGALLAELEVDVCKCWVQSEDLCDFHQVPDLKLVDLAVDLVFGEIHVVEVDFNFLYADEEGCGKSGFGEMMSWGEPVEDCVRDTKSEGIPAEEGRRGFFGHCLLTASIERLRPACAPMSLSTASSSTSLSESRVMS